MDNETNQEIKCFNCKKKFPLGTDYSVSIPIIPYKKQGKWYTGTCIKECPFCGKANEIEQYREEER